MITCNLSYVAGLFDGEGSISIIRCAYKNPKTKSKYSYIPRICIVNTNKEVIETVRNFFNYGAIRIYETRTGKTKYVWDLWGIKNLVVLLKLLYPYLIIKKEQCFYMLDYLKRFSNKRLAWQKPIYDFIVEEKEFYYLLLRSLKRI